MNHFKRLEALEKQFNQEILSKQLEAEFQAWIKVNPLACDDPSFCFHSWVGKIPQHLVPCFQHIISNLPSSANLVTS